MSELDYYCKCGYHTPVPSGMMIHLSYPENKNSEHGFVKAIKL